MTGIARSFYLNFEVYNKLQKQAKKDNTKMSAIINYVLTKYFNELEEKTKVYRIITCPTCGAEYSEKIKECPMCATKEIKDRIEEEKESKTQAENKAKQLIEDEYNTALQNHKKTLEWFSQGKANEREIKVAEERLNEAEKKYKKVFK